jgi:pentatricopeptide repeat protein
MCWFRSTSRWQGFVHEQIIQSGGGGFNVFVENSLVGIYVKCRSMTDAWRVFHKMPSQNAVTWTAMISGHEQFWQGQ